jgi:hypothetical protein
LSLIKSRRSYTLVRNGQRLNALSLGFFQFVQNARRRGKALLGELVVAALVA